MDGEKDLEIINRKEKRGVQGGYAVVYRESINYPTKNFFQRVLRTVVERREGREEGGVETSTTEWLVKCIEFIE